MRSPIVIVSAALALVACERPGGCRGEYCGTLVIATSAEPDLLLPPPTVSVQARDVHDQIFLKLADVGMDLNTIGDSGFVPQLAQHWEWENPTTLVFHLNPAARWHDGPPVTAQDVEFTYASYTNPTITPSASPLRHIAGVTARDSLTAVFTFKRSYPEAFFDAVFHMRVVPRHLLGDLKPAEWATAPFGHAPVGNGPYRFVSWTPGQRLELAADSTFFLGRPHIRRLVWVFGADVNAAVNMLIAGDADAFEFLIGPNLERVRGDSDLVVHRYLSSSFAYMDFNLRANGDTSKPHPIFGDREVRRAIAMGIDRERMSKGILGDMAVVPNGPVSPAMRTVWDDMPPAAPYDTAAAARLLESRGWRDANGDGVREKGGKPLSFKLLVNQSPIRGAFAQVMQEQLRAIGVQLDIDQTENNAMVERALGGKFDAVFQVLLTDPSPAASVPQSWTRHGFGGHNYGRYHNPALERALEHASFTAGSLAEVKANWRAAFEILNADVPAVWLFAPTSNAGIHRRFTNVQIRPDSWWALVRTWRIPPDQLIDRDRAEP